MMLDRDRKEGRGEGSERVTMSSSQHWTVGIPTVTGFLLHACLHQFCISSIQRTYPSAFTSSNSPYNRCLGTKTRLTGPITLPSCPSTRSSPPSHNQRSLRTIPSPRCLSHTSSSATVTSIQRSLPISLSLHWPSHVE